MTVILATVGFSPEKIHPVIKVQEQKEELVLFHDRHEKSVKAAHELAAYARKLDMPVRRLELDAFDLVSCCLKIRRELKKREGKERVVSIAGGTRVLASAALLASILEGVAVVHIPEETDEPQPLPVLKLRAEDILSKEQRRVLAWVHAHPGCLQREIGEALGLTKGTVSHHIRGLKVQGLVEARPDAEDGRSERLHAVPSAELLLME